MGTLRGAHCRAAGIEPPPHDDVVDRLVGDAELNSHLRAAGFAGREYEYFQTELARYGVAVLTKWLRTGELAAKCAEKGIKGVPQLQPGLFDDRDQAQELAGEIVAVALRHFRSDVLLRDRWDPARGASLKSYFIGQCLLRAGNVTRRWIRHDAPQTRTVEMTEATVDVIGEFEDDVIRAIAAQQILRGSTQRTRQVLTMVMLNYRQSEIAAQLGMTPKTVERILAHQRDRARKRSSA